MQGRPRETHLVQLRQDFFKGNSVDGQCNFTPFHDLNNIIPYRQHCGCSGMTLPI